MELIRKDIGEGVNRVVIAACSPRAMGTAFSFDDGFTDRVNLREQVVWSHEPGDEDTQMLAEDYVRMGVARVQKATRPQPYLRRRSKRVGCWASPTWW